MKLRNNLEENMTFFNASVSCGTTILNKNDLSLEKTLNIM